MKIKDIPIVGRPQFKARKSDVAKLESDLWISLPAGYADYVTKLGDGILSAFVRVYLPWRIRDELPEWRRRIAKYWFWDAGKRALPKDRAMECVILADTVAGDELVFHPQRPETLFVLPAENEKVFTTDADLLCAIDWMCSSGKLTRPITDREFVPSDSHGSPPSTNQATPSVTIAEISDSARSLAKSAKLVAKAKREIRIPFLQIPKTQLKITRQAQAVEFHDGKRESDSLTVTLLIEDKSSKLEIGKFKFSIEENTEGSSFEPNKQNWDKLRELYT